MENTSDTNIMKISNMNHHVFGAWRLKAINARRFSRDWRSYAYLLGNGRFKEALNFFRTKFVVPTGEGSFLGFASLLKKYPDLVPMPRYIEMETTTICNKRCTICEYVYWPEGEQVRRHLTFEEFRYMVDQFPVLDWVNLTGEGSSFLNPDYSRMLRYLWERDRTSIWLVDHLADIPFERLESDVLPYIQGMYISLDAATKGTYESIKLGCNFDNVVENLTRLIAYKRANRTPFPHLSFRYVLLQNNIHEMPLFLDLLNSIARPNEWGGSATLAEFTGLLYFDEIRHLYVNDIPVGIIEQLKERTNGIDFAFAHVEEGRNPPIEYCNAWLEPYIMLPGYALPCCAVMMSNRRPFLREYAFGNLFDDDFNKIWHSEYYTRFRSMVNDPDAPVPKICAGCRAFRTEERIARNGVWDVRAEDGGTKCVSS